jgi:hypothetical protein
MSSPQYRDGRLRQPEVYPSDWRRDQTIRIPRRRRQIMWLTEARDAGIWLQVEGGAGYGKDLRELVQRGMLELRRVPRNGLSQGLSRRQLLITNKGLAALQRGSM